MINLGSRGETGSLSIMGSGSRQLYKTSYMGAGNSLSANKPGYRGTMGRSSNMQEM